MKQNFPTHLARSLGRCLGSKLSQDATPINRFHTIKDTKIAHEKEFELSWVSIKVLGTLCLTRKEEHPVVVRRSGSPTKSSVYIAFDRRV